MRLAFSTALAAVLAASAALPAAATPAAPDTEAVQSESERLNAWFDRKYEEALQFSPTELSYLGRKEKYDEMDDGSIAAEDTRLAWYQASLAELESSFDYDALDPATRISYDLWKFDVQRRAEAVKWRGHEYIFNQMQGIHTAIPTFMINIHRVDSASDMDAYIARVGKVGLLINQLVSRARTNAAAGVRPPYFAYDAVLAEAQALVSGAPFGNGEDSALWTDGKAKIAALVEQSVISEVEGAQLQARLEAALTGPYKAGYDQLIGFMQDDRPNAPEIATGVGSLPDGAAYYASQLRAYTTTDLTAEQVHQIGLDEIARIRGEMEAIRQEVGFDGDLQAFFRHLESAEWNFYPDTDAGRQAYIDDATAAIGNIKLQLPKYFNLMPKADLVVKRVEAFREQPGAAQHYQAGTPDGSRPGVYYAHLSDMTSMPKNQMEVIAYHEGLPGHHMQISIAQELTGLPIFRTQYGLSAYSEGWGLYSEALAVEIPGTYRDPYARFGRLSSEIWRAIRLVVDTGLHAKGWTEAEAIAFFQANSPEPLESIRSEVRRYIVWPGQATSYKIGMIRIQQLRADAQQALGAKFDIREFHDAVLGGGALPLDILETRVKQWVAARQAG
jgi:uncharacterized protein (DUF885 family)